MSRRSTSDLTAPSGAIAIIPARYGSTRFPGKPLARIGGISMIERVWRTASHALGRAVVATDDERILREVTRAGGEAVMTSSDCPDGTARVAEAYSLIGSPSGIVVNVQGDEPLITVEQIRSVARVLVDHPEADIATLAMKFDPAEGFEALFNPNRVKLVREASGKALYFSRSIVPYVRDIPWQEWIKSVEFYIHIGLYAFRGTILQHLVSLPDTPLSRAEKLEQLRWLYHGYSIHTTITTIPAHSIDTPEDLTELEGLI